MTPALQALAALGALLLLLGILLPLRGYDVRPAQPQLMGTGVLLLALALVLAQVIR